MENKLEEKEQLLGWYNSPASYRGSGDVGQWTHLRDVKEIELKILYD